MHYLLIKIQLLWAKHTKWLDRNPVKVPVSKRVIAYAIDWAVGGIISGFPAVLFSFQIWPCPAVPKSSPMRFYSMGELLVDQICLVIFMFFLV